jgi:hypothetical protein
MREIAARMPTARSCGIRGDRFRWHWFCLAGGTPALRRDSPNAGGTPALRSAGVPPATSLSSTAPAHRRALACSETADS